MRNVASHTRADLDLVFDALVNGKVPPLWLKTYPSLKPLGSWTRDLLQRIDQLARWVEGSYPAVFWLSGFTYPTGFLTAVLQTTARKNTIPIDTLSFEYSVLNLEATEIGAAPKEGALVQGVFLEGAGWDFEEVRCSMLVAAPAFCFFWVPPLRLRCHCMPCRHRGFGRARCSGSSCLGKAIDPWTCLLSALFPVVLFFRFGFLWGRCAACLQECLCEPQPMELIVPMPIILFKPVENKKRGQKGVYSCPLYLYPVRTGTRERPSFMINVDLKAGASDPDHWIMRGTALLLALSM
jgi:hypothetical protein